MKSILKYNLVLIAFGSVFLLNACFYGMGPVSNQVQSFHEDLYPQYKYIKEMVFRDSITGDTIILKNHNRNSIGYVFWDSLINEVIYIQQTDPSTYFPYSDIEYYYDSTRYLLKYINRRTQSIKCRKRIK